MASDKISEVFLTNTKTTESKLEHLLRNLRQALVYRLKISFEKGQIIFMIQNC